MENQNESVNNSVKSQEEGRGTLILVFGILSLFFIGPFLGIPAWIMGHKDSKKIKLGSISSSAKTPTQIGMILGIVGTFVSLFLWIVFISGVFIGLSTFNEAAKKANRDGLIADATSISSISQVYYRTSKEDNRGSNSFIGFEIPERLKKTSNGTFSIEDVTDTSISIIGIGKEVGNDSKKQVSVRIIVKPESIEPNIINSPYAKRKKGIKFLVTKIRGMR
ncbi:MAG: hypothetical protein NTX22_07170 [Ignavibacteriales bacterium]|nr:hypothetical protein [Ignavibacteriales bacterium]